MLLGLTDHWFYFFLLLDLVHLDRLIRLGDLDLPIRLATHTRCSGTDLAVALSWPTIIQYW